MEEFSIRPNFVISITPGNPGYLTIYPGPRPTQPLQRILFCIIACLALESPQSAVYAEYGIPLWARSVIPTPQRTPVYL